MHVGADAQGNELIVRVWPNGARIERGDEKAPIPVDLAPDELTPEKAEELLAKGGGGPRDLGADPDTGLTVLVLNGRFGPFVQLGEQDPGSKDKPPARVAVRVDGARHGHARRGAAAPLAPACRRRRHRRRGDHRAERALRAVHQEGHRQPQPRRRGPALLGDARRGAGDLRPAQAATRSGGEAAARRPRSAPRDRARRCACSTVASVPTSPTAPPTPPCRAACSPRRSPSTEAVDLLAERAARGPAEEDAAKKSTAKKTTAKKSTAKKATAKKTTAKKAPAKRATRKATTPPAPGPAPGRRRG